ncbi:hypothetical protein AMK59_6341 [Oryctes borbonicus]|uniref:Thaumatin n=1 Tax=Oryctes borbonicus TaxID=1629725 RepID=A0A0T6B342_9SCAR|nr:hypothetical protein AMK59_6341 [Oryctes borbonicus]
MFAKVVLLGALIAGCHSVTFIIRNDEQGPIWVGIQGNAGRKSLADGGFALSTYQEVTVTAPDNWSGRFWARTWCNEYTFHCETGDCGRTLKCDGNGGNPPATLIEITLRGWKGQDYYDISLIEGFNIKASIEPVNGTGAQGKYGCKKAACNYYLNIECPSELSLRGTVGFNIGCKSACLAFNTDQYCCRGAYSSPTTCKPNSWSQYFKLLCPDAYSYRNDDPTSTFMCTADTYRITFG